MRRNRKAWEFLLALQFPELGTTAISLMIILLWSRQPSRELAEPAWSTPCCRGPEVSWLSHCGETGRWEAMKSKILPGHMSRCEGWGLVDKRCQSRTSPNRGVIPLLPLSLPFPPELFFRATVNPFRLRVTIIDTARCFPTCSKALACLDGAGHWLPASGCGTCFPGVPLLFRLQSGLPAQRCEQAEG